MLWRRVFVIGGGSSCFFLAPPFASLVRTSDSISLIYKTWSALRLLVIINALGVGQGTNLFHGSRHDGGSRNATRTCLSTCSVIQCRDIEFAGYDAPPRGRSWVYGKRFCVIVEDQNQMYSGGGWWLVVGGVNYFLMDRPACWTSQPCQPCVRTVMNYYVRTVLWCTR